MVALPSTDLAQQLAQDANLDMTACPYKSPFWRWMWVKQQIAMLPPPPLLTCCPHCHKPIELRLQAD